MGSMPGQRVLPKSMATSHGQQAATTACQLRGKSKHEAAPLPLQIAKGSFTRTDRNRKFNCPQRDPFDSYSGKHSRGSQLLQQL